MRKSSVKRPAIVEVEWLDSVGGLDTWATWTSRIEDLHQVAVMDHASCGYLIEKTEEYIAVALSLGSPQCGDSIGDIIQIPIGAVRKITQLRGPR